jgi:hypothetical protein
MLLTEVRAFARYRACLLVLAGQPVTVGLISSTGTKAARRSFRELQSGQL